MLEPSVEYVEEVQSEKEWNDSVNKIRNLVSNFWEIGKITAEVTKKAKYGDETLKRLARQSGIKSVNLYRYMRVYNEISDDLKKKYTKILSFCMFEELIDSYVSSKKYDTYLEKAVHENFSVSEFGRFLSGTLAGTDEEPLKPYTLKFPGELRGIIYEILDILAQEFKADVHSDYHKNKNILTAFVMACKDHLEGNCNIRKEGDSIVGT